MRAGELLISLIEGADRTEHTIESFDLIYRERSSTRPESTRPTKKGPHRDPFPIHCLNTVCARRDSNSQPSDP